MALIAEQTTVPSGSNKLSYDWGTVKGNDGKVYSPFYLRRYVQGYGCYVYSIALPYYGNRLTNPTLQAMGYKTFEAKQIIKNRSTGAIISTVSGNAKLNATGGYTDYNADKKIGYYCPNDFTTFITSASDFREISGWQHMFYIPYVGTVTDSNFWDNVANLPKPQLPFQIDFSTTGGGKGTYDDDTSDNVSLPDLSLLNANSINNTKFITLYKMSATQLTHLADVLWSSNFMTQLSNSVLKPMDFIISLQQFPINVQGVTKDIKAGRFLLNEFLTVNPVQGDVISGQFARVDCGEIEVKEKWGGAIDYQTDIQLFLPFIGTVSLSPQDVMASKIHVYYTVDLISGNCLASVLVKRGVLNSLLYQFNGNCSASYPITAENWSQIFSSALGLTVGNIGVSSMAGAIADMPDKTKRQKADKDRATSANIARGESVGMSACNNLIAGNFAPSVQRTGTLSSCAGFMGVKKPYLIISRLVQSLPKDFGFHKGFMSNVTKKLSDCKGFTQVRAMHLDNVIATVEEKNELMDILESGVIIK